ncbi:MAG: hypothetical protein IJZ47_02380 [Oscillospiraceae bacterium]|nr:hypothetical protein [Oscillospiraceae bacterium]
MNKEEILAKSREENKNIDLVELEVMNKSKLLAGSISGNLCFILFLAQLLNTGNSNYALLAILTSYIAVNSIHKGIKLKRRSSVIFGVIFAAAAIVTTVATVGMFFNANTSV